MSFQAAVTAAVKISAAALEGEILAEMCCTDCVTCIQDMKPDHPNKMASNMWNYKFGRHLVNNDYVKCNVTGKTHTHARKNR